MSSQQPGSHFHWSIIPLPAFVTLQLDSHFFSGFNESVDQLANQVYRCVQEMDDNLTDMHCTAWRLLRSKPFVSDGIVVAAVLYINSFSFAETQAGKEAQCGWLGTIVWEFCAVAWKEIVKSREETHIFCINYLNTVDSSTT